MLPEASTNHLAASAVSMDTSITSGFKAMRMRGFDVASFQAIWAGDPTGVFSFKQSNDPTACKPDGTIVDSAKFTALTSPAAFAALQPAGAAGSAVFGFADMACEWLLPVYTATSGTGSSLTSMRGVAL